MMREFHLGDCMEGMKRSIFELPTEEEERCKLF